jgi:hypothetical protein
VRCRSPTTARTGELIETLLRRHLLNRVEGRLQFFGRLLAEYVHQQNSPLAPEAAALRLDMPGAAR